MRILKKIVLSFLIIQTMCIISYASNSEIIETQKDMLNMSSFLKEAQNYADEAFPEMNIKEVLNSAIQGKTDSSIIYKAILSILGKEVFASIKVLR